MQIVLDQKSRAANVQRISAAIDAAAGADPSPDVLVLPGGCDTGGAAGTRGLHDASLTALRERLAGKAREWGVFIAAGLHHRVGGSFEPYAVLIDSDGDVAACSGDRANMPSEAGSTPARWWSTSIGRVGVLDVSEADPAMVATECRDEPALVAVPIPRSQGGKVGRATASLLSTLQNDPAAGAGLSWVVVAPADMDGEAYDVHAPLSFVRGPDGSILAAAKNSDETIVQAEIAVASS